MTEQTYQPGTVCTFCGKQYSEHVGLIRMCPGIPTRIANEKYVFIDSGIDTPQRPAPPPPVYCTGCPGTIDMSKQFVVNLAQGKAICPGCDTPVTLPPSTSVFWLPYNLPGIKTHQRVLNVVDDAAAKLKEACKAITTVAERRAGSDRRTTHYGSADDLMEAIKVIEAWGLNFSLGSALKYIRRAGHKATSTAVEDLEKAQAYVGFELARLKREQK